MILFSIFLAGFTLGIFFALRVFAPEKEMEAWDPQNFPSKSSVPSQTTLGIIRKKPPAILLKNKFLPKLLSKPRVSPV